jgi:hypothetical protein
VTREAEEDWGKGGRRNEAAHRRSMPQLDFGGLATTLEDLNRERLDAAFVWTHLRHRACAALLAISFRRFLLSPWARA